VILEGEPDEFMFDIQSAVAANERRVFLRRSADGMAEGGSPGTLVRWGRALRVPG